MRPPKLVRVYKVPHGYKALNVRRSCSLKSPLANLMDLLEALNLTRQQVMIEGLDF